MAKQRQNKSRRNKPKVKNAPSTERNILARENPDRWYELYPTWRFHKSDQDASECNWPFNMDTFDKQLFDKLISYERMLWKEIDTDTSGRKYNTKNHFIDINSIDKVARNRLESLNIDVDKLYSLTITGEKRLFGLLSYDGVFEILWYDLNHEVCPSKKRNT